MYINKYHPEIRQKTQQRLSSHSRKLETTNHSNKQEGLIDLLPQDRVLRSRVIERMGDKQQLGVNFPVGYSSQTCERGIITLESSDKKRSFQVCELGSLGSRRGVCLELRRSLLNGQIQLPSFNGCSCHFRFTDSSFPEPCSPHTKSLSHCSPSQRAAPDNYKLKMLG